VTLSPADRRLLFGVLEPPEGYRLDHAIGTTYTLDLLALLRVPLAATALPWSGPDGGRIENPFALLAALRQNAARISLYCHAGMTKVPTSVVPLLAFLEDCVHPVTPPRSGGVFHPKVWLLRFAGLDDDDPALYRLAVLSRNLTFDRSWDTVLSLDGRLLDRQRGLAENRSLSEFIATLPAMAERAGTEMPAIAADRAKLLSEEVRRVRWDLPDGFDGFTFHPIGHAGNPSWPLIGFHRLLVISPFVSDAAIRRLRAQADQQLKLISRYETLAGLDPALIASLDSVDLFDDLSAAVDGDGQVDNPGSDQDGIAEASGQLTGLHAKVFIGKRGQRAVVFVGSANATDAAFTQNVEFVVELEASEAATGIDRVYGMLDGSRLLTPFQPGEAAEPEADTIALQRRLERIAHLLATGVLRASATAQPDGRWILALHASGAIDLGGLSLRARPLLQSDLRPVDLSASPAVNFRSSELTRVTAFFVLELSDPEERIAPLLITARLPLDGAPDGRIEAVTAEMLSNPEVLLRFILVLLSAGGESDRFLDDLEKALTEDSTPDARMGGHGGVIGLPLLEPMLRALHRAPERLVEVDALFEDLRRAQEADGTGFPPELDELWQTITAVRGERA